MSDKTYYDIKAISNSSLKWFEISPKYFISKYNNELSDPKLPFLELGKKVHMAILEPDRFKDEFAYVDFILPKSKNQQSFCEEFVKEKKKSKDYKKAAVKAFIKNYSVKSKSEDKIEADALSTLDSLKEYIEFLEKKENIDKTLINKKNKEIIESGVLAIKSHKLANKLVINNELDLLSGNIETFDELEILFDYPKVFDGQVLHCKSMIDRLVVDHTEKKVKLVDIKTTFSIQDINSYINKYKYYRQLGFYWIAIEKFFRDKYPDLNIDEYSTESYIVFVSTNEPYECKVVKVADNVILSTLSNINVLMYNLAWHFKTENWDFPRDYYESDGYSTFNVSDLDFIGKENE